MEEILTARRFENSRVRTSTVTPRITENSAATPPSDEQGKTATAREQKLTRDNPSEVRSALIIDDNPNTLASAQILFDERGYSVLAAMKAQDNVPAPSSH